MDGQIPAMPREIDGIPRTNGKVELLGATEGIFVLILDLSIISVYIYMHIYIYGLYDYIYIYIL